MLWILWQHARLGADSAAIGIGVKKQDTVSEALQHLRIHRPFCHPAVSIRHRFNGDEIAADALQRGIKDTIGTFHRLNVNHAVRLMEQQSHRGKEHG